MSSSKRRAKWARREPGDFGRRRADVLVEQAPQVARAHAEPRREVVFGRVVERAVGDAPHRAAHELGRVDPARVGLAVGAAAQAGPEARRLGRGRVRVRLRVARAAGAPLQPGRQ